MQTKACPTCGEQKTLDCFSLNKSKKSGRSSECKGCHKIARRKYYEANKVKEIERVRSRREQQVQAFKDLKRTLRCKLCGENHVSTLHFHHMDPSQKEVGLSIAIRLGWGEAKLTAEMNKCVILCANCHAKEHYELLTTGKSLIN